MTCQRLIYVVVSWLIYVVVRGYVRSSTYLKERCIYFQGGVNITLGEVYGLSERIYDTSGAVYTSLRGLHVSSRGIWHIKSGV